MSMGKILVVDDDINICELLRLYIEKEGFEVVIANDGGQAITKFKTEKPDLIMLDIMLPVFDGWQVCREIRKTSQCPIIMLTAKSADMDKINGLMLGADDYITKPFNPLEVTARVKTQLRRFTKYNSAEPTTYDKDGLYVCPDTHICTLYGKEISLTPIEFNILWYLCKRCGKVVSSEELFEAVWGEKYLDNNNTVMAHIARLREKLGEPPRKPKFIKTVWGVGYKIDS